MTWAPTRCLLPCSFMKKQTEHVVDGQTDGLHPLWNGRRLQIPKAARVAVGSTFVLQGGIQGLLRLRRADELPKPDVSESGRTRVQI